jgi:hypothetical protein
MRKGVMTRNKVLPALGLLAALACGCVDYEERIELNPDGKTGMLRMHLAVDERFVAGDWPQPTSARIESIFPTTLEDIRKEVDCAGIELVDARASITPPMRHLYLVCRIKDVSKLGESPTLAQRQLVFKQDSPTEWTFREQMNITGTNILGSTPERTAKMLAQLEARFGSERVRGMLGNYRMTLSVSAPGDFRVGSTGGRVHRGSTVIWQSTLAQLFYSKEPWKMEARFVKAK